MSVAVGMFLADRQQHQFCHAKPADHVRRPLALVFAQRRASGRSGERSVMVEFSKKMGQPRASTAWRL